MSGSLGYRWSRKGESFFGDRVARRRSLFRECLSAIPHDGLNTSTRSSGSS
ncbi:hypothetical protein TPY_2038 [Sulfobacillus acidophilus TPY]|nr:hypothetical protein TPY_2038 [Sulfobacillus acidophilus TPY]